MVVVNKRQCLRYAISAVAPQGHTPLDTPNARRMRLAGQVRRWISEGVDLIQLREKQLEAGEIFDLAQLMLGLFHENTNRDAPRPRLLLNGRVDIAAAVGADGVHLPAQPGELTPAQAREIFAAAGLPECLVSVSCHTPKEAAQARSAGVDLILFGPVFEKQVEGIPVLPGTGLERLKEACSAAGLVPVLALGGITASFIPSCLEAGAAGVAGIRLFSANPPSN